MSGSRRRADLFELVALMQTVQATRQFGNKRPRAFRVVVQPLSQCFIGIAPDIAVYFFGDDVARVARGMGMWPAAMKNMPKVLSPRRNGRLPACTSHSVGWIPAIAGAIGMPVVCGPAEKVLFL